MDAASVTPRFRVVLGAVISAALLVPLAVYGAPAIAKSASSASHQYRSSCGEDGSAGGQYGASEGEYGSSDGQYGSSGAQYGSSCSQYRVQICHRRHSRKHPWRVITVSSRAVKAHLRHGDSLAPCSDRPFAKTHGKGHEHGNGKRGKHGDGGDSVHDRD